MRSFPFGARPIFRGDLLVLGSVDLLGKAQLERFLDSLAGKLANRLGDAGIQAVSFVEGLGGGRMLGS